MQKISLYGLEKRILPVYHPFMRYKGRYALLYGGRASGKSYVIPQKLVYRVIKERNHNILCVRQVFEDCRESQWEQIKKVIDDWGLSQYFTCKKSPLTIESEVFNSRFIFRGMSDSKRLKSITEPSTVWIEEFAEFQSYDDFLDLDGSVRGESKYKAIVNGLEVEEDRVKQIIMSFNPTTEQHFIYKVFFENAEPDEDIFIQKTTYHDNPYLTERDIKGYERVRTIDPAKYNVVYLGNWGILSKDSLFYNRFNSEKHIGKAKFDQPLRRDLPLWISFDFNVIPHCSASLFQIDQENKKIIQIKEMAFTSPHNSAKGMAEGVCSYLRKAGYKSHIMLTGDPSSKKRSTTHENGYSDFQIIEEVFKQKNFITLNRVPNKAESIELRKEFINEFFEFGRNGFEFLIYDNCEKSIIDFTNQKTKSMENGIKKDKARRKDPDTKEIMETMGHFSDNFDYFITTFFSEDVARYGKGGNLDNLTFVRPTVNPRMY